jgi:hypothetical protein
MKLAKPGSELVIKIAQLGGIGDQAALHFGAGTWPPAGDGCSCGFGATGALVGKCGVGLVICCVLVVRLRRVEELPSAAPAETALSQQTDTHWLCAVICSRHLRNGRPELSWT